jgi:hypothetical protein
LLVTHRCDDLPARAFDALALATLVRDGVQLLIGGLQAQAGPLGETSCTQILAMSRFVLNARR